MKLLTEQGCILVFNSVVKFFGYFFSVFVTHILENYIARNLW